MFGFLQKLTGADRMAEASAAITLPIRREVVRHYVAAGRRDFAAGASDRLAETWNPSGLSADAAIRVYLVKMRRRSRELFYNNEYAKHFYRLLKNNVVGHTGIKLQVRASRPAGEQLDTANNSAVEKAWRKWCKRGQCDVTRKLSFIDFLKLALENCARDGEVLIRKVLGYDNKFGFALQLLEADLLDETYTTVLPNGNTVRMGVELDQWGAPVAYHFRTVSPGDYLYGYAESVGTRLRIDAAEILHLYAPEFARQTRAVPWLHAAMRRAKRIERYETAEIVGAEVGASKMAFYERDPDCEIDDDEYEDLEAEFLSEAEPGTFGIIPEGYRLKEWNPQHPSGNYEPMMKRMMRGLSSGFGIGYSTLSNDPGDATFSSARLATDEDRDNYRVIQNWLIEWVCDWVYPEWLPYAVLSRQVALPWTELNRFADAAKWQPRTWRYINPVQDVTAMAKELEMGTETQSTIVAAKGGDYEELCNELKQQKEIEKSTGVVPGLPKIAKPQEGGQANAA